jgi:hypothetical protein
MWPFKRRRSDLVSLVEDSLKESAKVAAKTLAEKVGESAVVSLTAKLLTTTASAALGSIASGALGSLIESLLKGVDQTKELIKKLASEPYDTGIRTIRQALQIVPNNTAEHVYRSERIKFGIEKLESAFSLAASNDEQFFIIFLIGLAEMTIPGGIGWAAARFESAKAILNIERASNEEALSKITSVPIPPDDRDPRVRTMMNSVDEGVFGKPLGASTTQYVTNRQTEYRQYVKRCKPYEDRERSLVYLLQLTEAIVDNLGYPHQVVEG